MTDRHRDGPGPFEPAPLGPLRLRNRIIKAATFEGVMPRGKVTPELIDFHVAVARGGAALTTLAYCAVSMGGRVNRNTLVFTDDLIDDLRRLTEAVHAEGAAVSAQLGHAGLVAQGGAKKHPSMAPSSRFSAPAMGRVRADTASATPAACSTRKTSSSRCTARGSAYGLRCRSSTRTSMPRRASRRAAVRPTGPAPTTTTGASDIAPVWRHPTL